jgi:hypothetical protein
MHLFTHVKHPEHRHFLLGGLLAMGRVLGHLINTRANYGRAFIRALIPALTTCRAPSGGHKSPIKAAGQCNFGRQQARLAERWTLAVEICSGGTRVGNGPLSTSCAAIALLRPRSAGALKAAIMETHPATCFHEAAARPAQQGGQPACGLRCGHAV